MNLDLDKADIILEQYYEKISEQERLIIQLRKQCKEEVKAKENLLFKRNSEFVSHSRSRFENDNFTISQFSNNLITENNGIESISPMIQPQGKKGSSDTNSQQKKEIR